MTDDQTLYIIVKSVLLQYLDSNLLSEEARNRIAQDICKLNSEISISVVNAEAVQKAVNYFYEGIKS